MDGMKPLPLPVRIAAGLVATAVDQARDLPRLVVEFPVTAVSQALQATMRVQQKVTELAIKGDRALGSLRPVEEKPSWATFDDEPPRRNGASTVTELHPHNGRTPVAQPPATAPTPTAPTPTAPKPTASKPRAGAPKPAARRPVSRAAGGSRPATPEVVAAEPADPRSTAREAAAREAAAPEVVGSPAGDVTDAAITPSDIRSPEAAAAEVPDAQTPDAGPSTVVAGDDAAPATPAEPDEVVWTSESGAESSATAAGSVAAGTVPTPGPDTVPAADATPADVAVQGGEPGVLPGYANLTIPQLRGRLRFLSLSDLRTLLEWENAHGGRPAFVTMLSNRITTVQEG
jgi:hypothetical protein